MVMRVFFVAMAALIAVSLNAAEGISVDTNKSWNVLGLLPKYINSKAKTAAKWVWHQSASTPNQTALFRLTFTADSKVKHGSLALAGDDQTWVYLNGVPIKPPEFAKKVVAGRNVLAVKVHNIYGSGGLLVFADLTLESGAKLSLRSDAKSVRTADGKNEPAGWMSPGFDDSAWPLAYVQGDAQMEPFAKYRDYTKTGFATEAERQAIRAYDEARKGYLPTDALADEPEPVAKIVYQGNRPLIDVNGRLFEPDFNLCGAKNDYERSYAEKSRELGYLIYQVGSWDRDFEKGPGEYDFSSYERQVIDILKFSPDARFIFSFRLSLPKWLAKHPEAMIGYADGAAGTGEGDERTGRPIRPSAASMEYRAEVKHFFDCFQRYVADKPWRKRLIGIRPCWGIYTEWHYFGMYHGPDVGPAMTARFKRWRNGRYANENPPTMAERTSKAFLLDPRTQRKVMDFYECMANEVSDLLLFCAREVKRILPGRLAGFYYGYVFAIHPPEGANIMLEKVLSAPEVDFMSDPSMYSPGSRRAGGSYYHRTIPAAFHRYGKLSVIEDDMRFHHVMPWTDNPAITTETPNETRMTMRRNYLNKLFDGCGLQICDPVSGRGVRPFTYDDPAISLGAAEARVAFDRAGVQPKYSGNEVAIVVSAMERLHRDGAPFASARISSVYTAPEYFFRTGVAFDVLTLADYLAVPDDRYRKVVFLNVFGPLLQERRDLLAKTRRAGVTSLWMIAPGSVTPQGFSDRAMSELAGIKLKGASNDPKVVCADDQATPFVLDGVRKKLADGSESVFIPEAPKDNVQWREMFLALGAKPIAKGLDYVRRHGNLVMFHTAKAGEHTIITPDSLKGRRAVELFSGNEYSGAEFKLTTPACSTLLFRFD